MYVCCYILRSLSVSLYCIVSLSPSRPLTGACVRTVVYINAVNDSAEMALAITSRIPRMRNSTRDVAPEVHQRAQCLIDQLDYDATRLLEEMTMELQNHEHAMGEKSLTSVLRNKIQILEHEKSQLQSDVNDLQVVCIP